MSGSHTSALERLQAEAGQLGQRFFCDIRLGTAADPEAALARALGLAQALMGPVAAREQRARPGCHVVQLLHRDGGIGQVTVRTAPLDTLALELDGTVGSLRLEASGRLVRHAPGAATVLIEPP